MVGNIIANHHEFFDVFMLFAGSDAVKPFRGIKTCAAVINEKAHHQGIKTGFREGLFVFIFIHYLQKVTAQLPVQLRIFFGGN